MFDVSVNESKIVFVNTKTSKAETIDLLDRVPDLEAIVAIQGEQRAAQKASVKAISLLCSILDNPRLDGYKGITPINESIPPELKSAIRDLETEYIRPIFTGYHASKGATPAKVEQLWQEYATSLRKGGSYANAKSKVTAYFAHCGKLPIADNGKLLPLSAIEKLLQNAKEAAPKPEPKGISGKLVAIANDLDKRTETTILGDIPSAVAALKAMLATFEGLEREALESAMVKHAAQTPGHINPDYVPPTNAAANVVDNAMLSSKFEALKKQWEDGVIDDVTFQIKAEELGYSVDLVEESPI